MSDARLLHGDCLERMAEIEAGSVDLILADLPYGTTACKWDTIIPFAPLWEHYRRLLRPRGAVVLTARQPFTSTLVMSNREWFKYCWVWHKTHPTDVFNAKHKPLYYHEDVCVFSPGTTANKSPRRMTYNPQGLMPSNHSQRQSKRRDGIYDNRPSHAVFYVNQASNYPGSVLKIPSEAKTRHPTQKPVALCEYMIRTYSHADATVLDNTMGSGTTGVACLNTRRRFIGIESDPVHFATAESRIASARAALPLFAREVPA